MSGFVDFDMQPEFLVNCTINLVPDWFLGNYDWPAGVSFNNDVNAFLLNEKAKYFYLYTLYCLQ